MRRDPTGPPEAGRPGRLLVVGALGRMAQFFLSQVLRDTPWDEVTLLDVRPAVFDLEPFAPDFPTRRLQVILSPEGAPVGLCDVDGKTVPVPDDDAVVFFGVEHAQLVSVGPWLLPQVGAGSVVFDITSEKTTAMLAMIDAAPKLAVFGTHPLFSPSVGAIEGQTVVVSPSVRHPDAHLWLMGLLDRAGAFAKEMSVSRHDEAMRFVQTASHQALLTFADVVGTSGLDVERDLWECRTREFEALLALSSRVLSPQQETTVASIEVRTGGRGVAVALSEAQCRLRRALDLGGEADVAACIAQAREPFSGHLFEQMQRASGLAIAALQSPRTRLAAARRDGHLVGVVPKGRPDLLRVGRVEGLTATAVSIRNLLVGPKGGAALFGPHESGARKLGLNRTQELVEMGLGNIAIVTGPRRDELLEEWLGTVVVDAQVMASGTVADRGLVRVAIERGLVRSAVVVRDAIWRGRREAIVRCEVRADQRLETLPQRFQRAVDELFGRPIGALAERSREYRSDDPLRLGFLGPVGTFSEIAARHVEVLVAPQSIAADPLPSFGDLLSNLGEGVVDVIVLPIFSSSSGLVRDAALALGSASASVRGIGVVDVTVSFDAYVSDPDRRLDGGRVASHSQGVMQCSNFIDRHELVPVPADSTVAALEMVTSGDADVALAPPGLGADLGLAAVAMDVGNFGAATTRFLVLAAAGSPLLPEAVAGKAARGVGDQSAWLVVDPARTPVLTSGIRRDEVFQSELGHRLWLSSDSQTFDPGAGVVALGAFPWPVTPTSPA